MSDLIYDIGMHEGEDSKFYLAKGFRVVAVEADPLLCEQAADRLGQFIQSGQLTIVNRAIAPTRGPIILYRCDWLIDLMDQSGHDLAKFCQPLYMDKLRLQFMDTPFTRVAVRQVAEDFGRSNDLATCVPDWRYGG